MYINKIAEVEIIIFSYLSQITDWYNLRQTNNYYKKLLSNGLTCKQFYPNYLGSEFINACEKNNLFGVKCIFYNTIIGNISEINKIAFLHSCKQGYLDIAKWLLQINHGKFNIHAKDSNAFLCASEGGHLDLLKWLFKNEIRKDKFILHSSFRSACHGGHLNVAKWLMKLAKNRKVDISKDIEVGFSYCCLKNHLEMAAWLFELSGKTIDLHEQKEHIFRSICEGGNLKTAKWFYKFSNKKINIHALDEYAFRNSCRGGHLEMAKWLLDTSKSLDQSLDIYAINNYAYKYACENNHLHIVDWLLKLMIDNNNLSDDESHAIGWFSKLACGTIQDHEKYKLMNSHNNLSFTCTCENDPSHAIRWFSKLARGTIQDHEKYGYLNSPKHYFMFNDKSVNLRINNKMAFICSHLCEKVNVTKWFVELIRDNETNLVGVTGIHNKNCVTLSIGHIFNKVCIEGHLDIVKWLYNFDKKNLIFHLMEGRAFHDSCANGHLGVAKWLYKIFKSNSIDITSVDISYAFNPSCKNGHLKVAQWLYKLSGKSIDDMYSISNLRHGCKRGDLEMAKWLYKIDKKKIEKSINYILKTASKVKRPDIILWATMISKKID